VAVGAGELAIRYVRDVDGQQGADELDDHPPGVDRRTSWSSRAGATRLACSRNGVIDWLGNHSLPS
jgi:hypothetical protein